MAENSSIEWTDHTWSPWEGCTKVSPACDHCYAARMNGWLKSGNNWGPGAPRMEYRDEHWEKPVKWQRNAAKFHTLHGRRQRVFPSVCDPFDNEVHQVRRERFWGLIRLTPNLDWLLLTKRIGNAKNMLPKDWGDGYPNVWLGSTVCNQEEAYRDIPKLLAVPARIRFLSIEPMLEAIDLRAFLTRCDHGSMPGPGGVGGVTCTECGGAGHGCHRLHWVICGGESGSGARPMHPDWPRGLRRQCQAAGVPMLFKQWGEWAPATDAEAINRGEGIGGRLTSHGRIEITPLTMQRVGKKAAGRLLDGVEHNGFPEGTSA